MKFRNVVLSAAVLLSTSALEAKSPASDEAANVQLIKDFLTDTRAAMASHDPARARAVAERYMDVDYIQHSKGMKPGREGYIETMTSLAAGGPLPGGMPPGAPPAGGPPPPGALPAGAPSGALPSGGAMGAPMTPPKDLYFVGDGELVVWVSEGMEPGKLDFNMVRIVNGKMKEHWDSR